MEEQIRELEQQKEEIHRRQQADAENGVPLQTAMPNTLTEDQATDIDVADSEGISMLDVESERLHALLRNQSDQVAKFVSEINSLKVSQNNPAHLILLMI